jgi:hypothetical protein
MSTAADRLFDYLLAKAAGEALPLRAQLYRDAAAVLSGDKYAAPLLALAKDCEAIERRAKQLRLDLGDGNNGGPTS